MSVSITGVTLPAADHINTVHLVHAESGLDVVTWLDANNDPFVARVSVMPGCMDDDEIGWAISDKTGHIGYVTYTAVAKAGGWLTILAEGAHLVLYKFSEDPRGNT